MNNYNKIKSWLELGTLKGVAVKDGDVWRVLTHINGRGRLEGTTTDVTINEALSIGLTGASWGENECDHLTDITPIPMKPKVLPVGTKVEVSDIIKECDDYEKWYERDKKLLQEIIDGGGVIEFVEDNLERGLYYGVRNRRNQINYVPAYCVIPVFENETTSIEEPSVFSAEILEKTIKKLKEEKAKRLEFAMGQLENISRKYLFYAGEWHEADCDLIFHDKGVCFCDCHVNKERVRRALDRI